MSGCSGNRPIERGYVMEMRYDPEHEYKKNEIVLVVPIQVWDERTYVDDADYIVTFFNNVNGQFKQRTVYTTKSVYKHISVGDIFDCTKMPYEDEDVDFLKE